MSKSPSQTRTDGHGSKPFKTLVCRWSKPFKIPGRVSYVLSQSHLTQEEDHNAHQHLQWPCSVCLGHALGSCDDAAVLLGPPSEFGPGQDGPENHPNTWWAMTSRSSTCGKFHRNEYEEPVGLELQSSMKIGPEGP